MTPKIVKIGTHEKLINAEEEYHFAKSLLTGLLELDGNERLLQKTRFTYYDDHSRSDDLYEYH